MPSLGCWDFNSGSSRKKSGFHIYDDPSHCNVDPFNFDVDPLNIDPFNFDVDPLNTDPFKDDNPHMKFAEEKHSSDSDYFSYSAQDSSGKNKGMNIKKRKISECWTTISVIRQILTYLI